MKKFFKSLLGDPEAATLKGYKEQVKKINALEPKYKDLSDAKLKSQTEILKENLAKSSLDEILPAAFATVREVSRRILDQRHYDVQIMGGICLHEGKVAEMRTGEGKTLVATLPLYLNALSGKGAHLVTVNDYLAQLGAGWMGPIYDFLGLSVGIIIPEASFIYDPSYDDESKDDERLRHLQPCTRQEAYLADITYGTNNEFGFDYLRDNMVRNLEQIRQRELHFAIVDEVDSILIDEARTPLIISAPSVVSGQAYEQFAQIVSQLKSEHYVKDAKLRSVVLTDLGVEELEKILGLDNFYAVENTRSIYHLEQALRAQILFDRDTHYIVDKGQIVIIDEYTGRKLPGRRYNEGLHQALEAKEGVEVQQESMTLAKVSFQNYFRLYEKLSGMTGTAETEREEFYQIYKLDVVVIPTNEPIIRVDHSDIIYWTESGKYEAITQKVKELNAKGQPVLIGTASIEKNEYLAKLLNKAQIKYEVLNAKNNTKEALIVSQAGEKGAVTLATNIAGRGTDIVLGEGVVELGGLFVLGSERHSARRIDNQLRGRSGRQGDPGESQFFVSLEDEIIKAYAKERLSVLLDRFSKNVDKKAKITDNKVWTKLLTEAQKKVEHFHFDSRKNIVQYDDVMNKHRLTTYKIRKQLLEKVDVTATIKDFLREEVKYLASLPGQDEEYEQLLSAVFPFDDKTLDKIFDSPADTFADVLDKESKKLYEAQAKLFDAEAFATIQREIYFKTLDNLWMNHLEQMDYMQQNVQWISVGQRDPLVEYRRQAQQLYDEMQNNLRRSILRILMHARPIEMSAAEAESDLTRAARSSVSNADKVIELEVSDDEEESDYEAKRKLIRQQNQNLASKKKKKRKQQRQNRRQGRR